MSISCLAMVDEVKITESWSFMVIEWWPLKIETLKPLMILSSILWGLNLCSYLCRLGRSIQYSSFSRWEVRVKVSSLLKDMLCKAEQSFSILCLFLVMLPDFCSTGPQLLSYQRLYHWFFFTSRVFLHQIHLRCSKWNGWGIIKRWL